MKMTGSSSVILYMAGFAVGQIFFGPLSDHYGRKPILMVGLAVFIFGTIGALWARSFEMLLIARLVQGIGAASPRIIAIAVVRDLYAGRQMARVMSFAMMVFITIPVLAPSVGQALVHLGNWHWIFFVLLAMASAAALWSGTRLPETARPALGIERAMTLRQSFFAAILNPQTAGYGAAGGFMFGCCWPMSRVPSKSLSKCLPSATSSRSFSAPLHRRSLSRRSSTRGSSVVSACGAFPTRRCWDLSACSVASRLGGRNGSGRLRDIRHRHQHQLFPVRTDRAELQRHRDGAARAQCRYGIVRHRRAEHGDRSACGRLGRAGVFDGSIFPIAAGFAVCSLITGAIVLGIEGTSGLFGRNRPA